MTISTCVAMQSRDHPREYGENMSQMEQTQALAGSSPRIRGECSGHRAYLVEHGIIPANTGRILQSCILSFGTSGSSPRIRGECNRDPIIHQPNGIIPANTGRIPQGATPPLRPGIIPANTGRIYRRFPPSLVTWDHPREYGENILNQNVDDLPVGSSPRIRGE